MNVIVVNDHLYPDGGADVVALSSAEALSRAGLPVTLFVADALRPDDRTVRRAHLVCTGQGDLLRSRQRGKVALQGLWNAPAARQLRQLLQQFDPGDTVVHLHSWTKSLSSSVVRAVVSAGFPVVCTLHDYFVACPNGTLYDFQHRQVCTRTPMSASCVATHCDARRYTHKLYRVARQAVQQSFGGLPDTINEFIVVTRFSEKLLRPFLPRHAQVHLVRNPIEVAQQPMVDPGASKAFVLVARLFRPKGQAMFLEACELAGVQGVCVGDGPDLGELRARFPKARFTGLLDRREVVREMSAARCLVMPSHWYETQGLVVSEAAALGVPALVSDGCAAIDAVSPEETGLLFRADDVGALAAALRRLRDDTDLVRRLGGNAYQRFWADPASPAEHAVALQRVYRRVLDRHNGRVAVTARHDTQRQRA